MQWKTFKLVVHVTSGHDLATNCNAPYLYVHLSVRDQFQISNGVSTCPNPVWDEIFTFHNVLPDDTLDIKVCFSDVWDNNEPMGLIKVPLRIFQHVSGTPLTLPMPSGNLGITISMSCCGASHKALPLLEDSHGLYILLVKGDNLERYGTPCVTLTFGQQQYTSKALGNTGTVSVWNSTVALSFSQSQPEYLLISVHGRDLKEPSPSFQQVNVASLVEGVPQEINCSLHASDRTPFSSEPFAVQLCALLVNHGDTASWNDELESIQFRVSSCTEANGVPFTEGYIVVKLQNMERCVPLNAGIEASVVEFITSRCRQYILHCTLQQYDGDGQLGSCIIDSLALPEPTHIHGQLSLPLLMSDAAMDPMVLHVSLSCTPWRPSLGLINSALPTVQRILMATSLPKEIGGRLSKKVVHIQLKGARRIMREKDEPCHSMMKFSIGQHVYTSSVAFGGNPIWAEEFTLPVDDEVTQTLNLMVVQIDGQVKQRQRVNFNTLIKGYMMEFNIPMLSRSLDNKKWESAHPPCQVQMSMLAINFGRLSPEQPKFKAVEVSVVLPPELPEDWHFQLYMCGVTCDTSGASREQEPHFLLPVFNEDRDQLMVRVMDPDLPTPLARTRVALQGLVMDSPVELICSLSPKGTEACHNIPDGILQVALVMKARGFGDLGHADWQTNSQTQSSGISHNTSCSSSRTISTTLPHDQPATEAYVLRVRLLELLNFPFEGDQEIKELIFKLATGRCSRKVTAKLVGSHLQLGQELTLPFDETSSNVNISLMLSGSYKVYQMTCCVDPARMITATEVVTELGLKDQSSKDVVNKVCQLKCMMQCLPEAHGRSTDGAVIVRPNLHVQLVEGRNLVGQQVYVKFLLGTQRAKSSMKNNTSSRVTWNEGFEFDVEDPDMDVLHIHAAEVGSGMKSEQLGKYTLRLDELTLHKQVLHDCVLRIITSQGWERARPLRQIKLRLETLGPPFSKPAVSGTRCTSIGTASMPIPLLREQSHDIPPDKLTQIPSELQPVPPEDSKPLQSPRSPRSQQPGSPKSPRRYRWKNRAVQSQSPKHALHTRSTSQPMSPVEIQQYDIQPMGLRATEGHSARSSLEKNPEPECSGRPSFTLKVEGSPECETPNSVSQSPQGQAVPYIGPDVAISVDAAISSLNSSPQPEHKEFKIPTRMVAKQLFTVCDADRSPSEGDDPITQQRSHLRDFLTVDGSPLPALTTLCRLLPVGLLGERWSSRPSILSSTQKCTIHRHFLLPTTAGDTRSLSVSGCPVRSATLLQCWWRCILARRKVIAMRQQNLLRLQSTFLRDAIAVKLRSQQERTIAANRIQAAVCCRAAKRRMNILRRADYIRLREVRVRDDKAIHQPSCVLLSDDNEVVPKPSPSIPAASTRPLFVAMPREKAAAQTTPVIDASAGKTAIADWPKSTSTLSVDQRTFSDTYDNTPVDSAPMHARLWCRLLSGKIPDLAEGCCAFVRCFLGDQAFCSARAAQNKQGLAWGDEFTFRIQDPTAETLDMILFSISESPEEVEVGRLRLRVDQLAEGRKEEFKLELLVRQDGEWVNPNVPILLSLQFMALHFGVVNDLVSVPSSAVADINVEPAGLPSTPSSSAVPVSASPPDASPVVAAKSAIKVSEEPTPVPNDCKPWPVVLDEFLHAMEHSETLLGLYDTICQKTGLKPNKAVQRLFTSIAGMKYLFLKELSFANNYFGDRGIQSLCCVFQNLPSLESLDLRNNFMTTEGLAAVTHTLAHHPSLTKLDLRDNKMIFTKEDGRLLLELVTVNHRICHLLLEGTDLLPTVIKRIQQRCTLNRQRPHVDMKADAYRLAEAIARVHLTPTT